MRTNLLLMIVAAVVSGCTTTTAEQQATSPETTLVIEAHAFEGGGDAETESIVLAGDYLVTWSIAGNTSTDGATERLVILLQGDGTGPARELTLGSPPIQDGSRELRVTGLADGEYRLTVSAAATSTWSVTFERLLPEATQS